MKPIRLLLAAAVLSSSFPARAIELSLEENRGERGSVGYVDMRRLFDASPDATRAREGLEELVRQAEERVNTKKVELLRLRQELGALKIEREELAKSTPTVSVPLPTPPPPPVSIPEPPPLPAKPLSPTPAPKPVEAPKPPEPPKLVEPPLIKPVTAAPPAPAAATAAATATPPPLTINLPGLTDGPLNLERPGGSPLNPTRAKAEPAPLAASVAPVPPVVAPVAVSTPTAPVAAPVKPAAAPVIVSTPTAPSVPAAVAVSTASAPVVVSTAAPSIPAGPTIGQRLLELDGRIAAKQAEVERLQADLDKERLSAERTLLDAEGRKTDQVLAKLYRAISEVAKREGVSVVVDKSTTLYGHPAVDLTEKILKQLRGVVPAQ